MTHSGPLTARASTARRLLLGAAGLITVDEIFLITVRDAGRQSDAMPGSPGAVELPNIGQAVVVQRRTVPSRPEAVADKVQEPGPAADLDQEPRDRITLAVERHQVL